MRIRVDDQVSEGERVASRWVAEGHNRGLGPDRQLGPWRTLKLGLAWLR